jgi:2-keto-3-deoxy-L-rhamnonate aldolase RhmA
MSLKLMYITNRPEIAEIAEASGVDWIFVDLELRGKAERQGHLDTVISRHQFQDVKKIRQTIRTAQLLVRVNPVYENSAVEINQIIANGADIIMLPYFTVAQEVESFIRCVDGRVKTCLLVETPDAVSNIDAILKTPGIDFIHIGLNDLHLGYGMQFMFELLADGTVERLSHKFRNKGIPFGFGGIAGLGSGTLPAERVIAEHYRLGSEMAILSRSFCNHEKCDNLLQVEKIFRNGITEIRDYEMLLQQQDEEWFRQNQLKTAEIVEQIKQKNACELFLRGADITSVSG